MNFDKRKRKLSKDEGGVSEVIGNILILMITVILFTSIIAFVNQMPLPEQQTKVNFVADLVFNDNGTKADLTLRHAGGAVLDASKTLILINRDGVMKGDYLSNDSHYGTSGKWTTGGVWKTRVTGTSYSSVITVTVVDMAKKSAVWTSQVTGGIGENPPAILQRWLDSNEATPTADPVRYGDNFTFYVTISDVDGDLNPAKIWIDAHELGGPTPYPSKWMAGSPSGDVFSWYFLTWSGGKHMASAALDGGTILIHAEDALGHVSESTFTMVVTKLPSDYITGPSYKWEGMDYEGLDIRLGYASGQLGCAYGFFGENLTTGTVNMDDNRTPMDGTPPTFNKDEMVFIEVAHKYMPNAIAMNSLVVKDSVTGREYTPRYVNRSTAALPFYITRATGTTYYECEFNTSTLAPGTYILNISLASSTASGVPVSFFASPSIIVGQKNSTITFYPEIKLYESAAYNKVRGDKLHPFNVSEGTYMIYVALKVLNTQAAPNPTVDDIRISDMAGGSELYGRPPPPAQSMIPDPITMHNATWYKFRIDLRYNNGNLWLSGLSSYSLRITGFADANEGVYSLTTQVFIKAITGRADFFLGEDGINVGHANFDTKGYMTYVENNNFFTTQTLYQYTNTPSDRTTYTTTAMAFGDLTGDGARDILIGQDTSYQLLYYKNSMNTLGGFQAPSSISRPDPTVGIRWITTGDINGDKAMDIAYVSMANKIVIYNNTYGMAPWVYADYGATVVKKIMLKDMTGDGKADLIMLKGGKVYVHDLTRLPLNPQVASIPDPDTTASAITDFDIADMNSDGMLDILTAGGSADASVTGVWCNNYTWSTSALTKHPNFMTVGAGKVTAGDLSNLNSPDESALILQENDTVGIIGRVNVTMQFPALDAGDKNQLLSIVAKMNPGPGGQTEEVFYVWYSVDPNLATANFIPIFAITNKDTFVNYTFRLPAMAAGKPIFLRFTDSSTSLGSLLDSVAIDCVSVSSGTYGKYYKATATPSRYQVVGIAPVVYTAVRAGNIAGHAGHLDVVVARNSYWAAYDGRTAIPWLGQSNNASFYVQSTNALMANTAPTLFDVQDINGDGLSDILTCYKTPVQNTVSKMGYWMNLAGEKIFYSVIELGRTDGSGSITVANAVNLVGV